MNEYDRIRQKQKAIEKARLLKKQEKCKHTKLDHVYSIKCVSCHKDLKFRTPEDISKRGEMGKSRDF